MSPLPLAKCCWALALWAAVDQAHSANIQFQFNQGFDDPSPVAPVSGNSGTTLGQQRQILFQAAAQVWADLIDSPVTIVIAAEFIDLECTANGAVLGAAGPAQFALNNSLMGGAVLYPSALEDALIGSDLDPGQPDIITQFNALLDAGNCGPFAGFYYGLDNNVGANQSALFSTVLHEIAHGLGFSSLIGADGDLPPDGPDDFPGVFDLLLFDVDDDQFLVSPQSSDQDRSESVLDDPNLVWDGANVTNALAGRVVSGINDNSIRMHAPPTFAQGSSVSHFSADAFPNLLMEPNLNVGLDPGATDLTPFLFQDLGYTVTFPADGVIFVSGFEDGQ